jgi:hypothetical protein
MNSLTNLSPQQLRRAADLQEKISSLQGELAKLLGGAPAAASSPAPKRKISAAGIARIRAAQKERWAREKAKAPTAPAATPPKSGGKRQMSPAAKAKLGARMRAIWAARKAAK